MPKVAMNYQNTIIYKIVCSDLNITDTYVGHTTNFIQRKCGHKTSCNNEGDKSYNLKIYTTIRATGGWDNWAMIQIEEYSCNNLNEATARERYWIETLHSILNSCIPNRTPKEVIEYNKQYHKENIDKYKEVMKQYYIDNADKIKDQAKEYREKNRDKINEKQNEKAKENREKLNEKAKENREKNRDKINEKRRQKYKEKKNNNPTDPLL
jgi:hypothetical protein